MIKHTKANQISGVLITVFSILSHLNSSNLIKAFVKRFFKHWFITSPLPRFWIAKSQRAVEYATAEMSVAASLCHDNQAMGHYHGNKCLRSL